MIALTNLAPRALLSIVVVTALGCGGPPRVRSAAGVRLPANGETVTTSATVLPMQTISVENWKRTLGERLRPTCDAREGSRTADASSLKSAGDILASWTQLHSKKSKSTTSDGKRLGGSAPEPTRDVSSIGMTCDLGKSTVQVNGVLYPFDQAWVVFGKGNGKTLDGTNDAGQFVMIQALSYQDKRVVFAKVYVPSNANDDTDDTVVITSLASYLPVDGDEPIVRSVSEREDPQFETFLPVKGTTEGVSFRVPEEDPLGRARYLGVGRFTVTR